MSQESTSFSAALHADEARSALCVLAAGTELLNLRKPFLGRGLTVKLPEHSCFLVALPDCVKKD